MTEAETRLDFRSAFGFWICSFWLTCISLFSASAQAAFSHSLQPIALTDVRWTHGFWADRQEVCRTNIIPALWSIMSGTNYTYFLQNFRIAAGTAAGGHRGASFNDGDFYKWLEAASASLARTKDPEVERWIEESIDVIGKAQRADGYLQTRVLLAGKTGLAPEPSRSDAQSAPFRNPLDFELYNLGHLFSAASLHHRITGGTNLLAIAVKAAAFLDKSSREPLPAALQAAICPSHYMGLVDLAHETGDKRYLELAIKLFSLRSQFPGGTDDNQDRIPFEQQTNAVGHSVRANYLYAGAADLYRESGNEKFWQPLEPIWTNVTYQKMYVTGGCGALFDGASPDGAKDQKTISRIHQAYGRDYQLPNLAAHSETCANIGNVLWNWRMFLVTGEAKYMDVVELALYNSVLSGIDLAGTNFLYVNPLRSLSPMPFELRWQHRRVPFLSSFCCPPNLARTIAEANGYAYAKATDSIWVNLYGASTLTTQLASGESVVLSQETEYPWNGRVLLTVEQSVGRPFSLHLRIPGWAAGASLRINGLRTNLVMNSGTYIELRRGWLPGDQVELDLPMPARLLEANPKVEETLGQVAVRRGPLIYCLETPEPRAQNRKATASSTADRVAGVEPTTSILDVSISTDPDLVARFDRNLLGGVVVIDVNGYVAKHPIWDQQLYREFQSVAFTPANLRFIPYFAWGNRGLPEMSVWIPVASKQSRN